MGSFVVSRYNRFELFLSGCVPHLQLDNTAFGLDGSNFEVDSDGGEEVAGEDVIGEPHEETRFADARVPDEENFKDEVKIGLEHV